LTTLDNYINMNLTVATFNTTGPKCVDLISLPHVHDVTPGLIEGIPSETIT